MLRLFEQHRRNRSHKFWNLRSYQKLCVTFNRIHPHPLSALYLSVSLNLAYSDRNSLCGEWLHCARRIADDIWRRSPIRGWNQTHQSFGNCWYSILFLFTLYTLSRYFHLQYVAVSYSVRSLYFFPICALARELKHKVDKWTNRSIRHLPRRDKQALVRVLVLV